ncbi:MAG: 7-cyano-7-deazaguanine synthase [Dehalococcoidia bacterium]|nr:7-cyano-7-deazaguanine synthase [Dehalococcoidia bacterium]
MNTVAVLTSGGLDSCVLLADMARNAEVWPIYVRAGLVWEDEERRAIDRFIAALDSPNVRPLVELSAPMRPIYGDHWSTTGVDVPKPGDADDAVFMPGRNIVLIGLAAVWCSTRGVNAVAIGSLGGNPFPDATPEFFDAYGAALSRGLGHKIEVLAPYRGRTKIDLIRENNHLPLELSLTCMTPVDSLHCGQCQKCEERIDAFTAAGVEDRTEYAALLT